jgi:hypothetical protein
MTPQTINSCFAIVTREVEEVQAALRAERAVREDFADFQRKRKEEEHVYLQSIILASADHNKAMALTIAKLRTCLTPDELLPIVKPLDNIQPINLNLHISPSPPMDTYKRRRSVD